VPKAAVFSIALPPVGSDFNDLLTGTIGAKLNEVRRVAD
jgi:hypothetical protein